MRNGWDCSSGAAALGLVSESKFSQAINPALTKLALLVRLNPAATFADLAEAIRRIPQQDLAAAQKRLSEHEDRCIEADARVRDNRMGRVSQT